MDYSMFIHFSTSIYVSLFRDGPSSISRRASSPAAIASTLAKAAIPPACLVRQTLAAQYEPDEENGMVLESR